jgi:hypothetical protein
MLRKYSLYILNPRGSNPDELEKKYRFFRMNPGYYLIYTDKRKPCGSEKVLRPTMLSTQEIAWLMNCNMQIQEEIFQKNADTAKAMQKFLEDLEQELKAEQEKETEKGA